MGGTFVASPTASLPNIMRDNDQRNRLQKQDMRLDKLWEREDKAYERQEADRKEIKKLQAADQLRLDIARAVGPDIKKLKDPTSGSVDPAILGKAFAEIKHEPGGVAVAVDNATGKVTISAKDRPDLQRPWVFKNLEAAAQEVERVLSDPRATLKEMDDLAAYWNKMGYLVDTTGQQPKLTYGTLSRAYRENLVPYETYGAFAKKAPGEVKAVPNTPFIQQDGSMVRNPYYDKAAGSGTNGLTKNQAITHLKSYFEKPGPMGAMEYRMSNGDKKYLIAEEALTNILNGKNPPPLAEAAREAYNHVLRIEADFFRALAANPGHEAEIKKKFKSEKGYVPNLEEKPVAAFMNERPNPGLRGL